MYQLEKRMENVNLNNNVNVNVNNNKNNYNQPIYNKSNNYNNVNLKTNDIFNTGNNYNNSRMNNTRDNFSSKLQQQQDYRSSLENQINQKKDNKNDYSTRNPVMLKKDKTVGSNPCKIFI
jgi:hypothetical protein